MVGDKLPVVTSRQLIAVLERLGFRHRPLGATSHRRYIHPDGRRTTVPVHKGQDIGRGLLRKILKDIELSPSEFVELL
jgi:predicted RNA binding protein YcfA (HicA-like mRNA interferase family)